jgi:hypothetical protein
MKDYLQYLVDEGFVDIRYWIGEGDLIDGRIASIKEHEPIYAETEEGSKLLIWRTTENTFTYTTTRQFFTKYGKKCKDENQALIQSNKWIREMKEVSMSYK